MDGNDEKPENICPGFKPIPVPSGQDWEDCTYLADEIPGLRQMLAQSRILHEDDNVIYMDFAS